MFLDRLVQTNPELARAAVDLHQSGQLPPSTYVLDLDAMGRNAELICTEAHRLGLTVYAMTKQFGRNPLAMRTLTASGVDGFVAVDIECARAVARAEQRLGHVGHLVQIPSRSAAEVVDMRPDYWTVFTGHKAAEAAAASLAAGRDQRLLARVYGPDDIFVESHAGGFDADAIEKVAESLNGIPGASFGGLTSYPAMYFDRTTMQTRPTHNMRTLEDCVSRLHKAGWDSVEVNAPGTTSTAVLGVLAEAGATQVEPGHGFTGTTPLHAVADLPEKQAVVFVSEISHSAGGSSYCYGGGLYQCVDTLPGQLQALVGRDGGEALVRRADVHLTDYGTIDFYGRLTAPAGTDLRDGDTVVMCFRAQVFYTRANVAAVSGISTGAPRVEGLFDSDGRPL